MMHALPAIIAATRQRGAAFDPRSVAGLKLWLKADAGLYQDSAGTTPATANNDPVGRWTDWSGQGNHATQATAGNRPLLKTAIQNGLPAVRFDGISNHLLFTAWTQAAANYTFFVVVNPTSLAAANVGIFDAQTGRLTLAPKHDTTNQNYAFYDGVSWKDGNVSATGMQQLTWDLLAGAGAANLYKNGANVGAGLTYPQRAIGGTVGVFGTWTGGNVLTGDALELLAYTPALSTANRQAIESYLNAKYAIY